VDVHPLTSKFNNNNNMFLAKNM